MTTLASALEETVRAERRRACRALLARPLLVAGGRDDADFRLVRKHATHLRDWFETNTGWWLSVDVAVARLRKRVADTDGTRGITEGGTLFTRRRYVLLCTALAVLERSAVQTTLGALAAEVVSALGDERFAGAGVEFALEGRDQRSDLAAAVRLLLDLGVLRRVDGDEQRFVDGSGDVLYDVERRALGRVLATAVAPSVVAADTFETRLTAITEAAPVDTDDARNRALRRSLTRRLLDDPVLYIAELTDDERAYLTSQRRFLTDRIEEATGLVAEARAEGIAMVDPDDRLTDLRMPERGTAGHVALLVAEALGTESVLGRAAVTAIVARAQKTHASHWSRAAVEQPAAHLAAAALDRLTALRLVRIEGEDVIALPAIRRYRVGAARVGAVPVGAVRVGGAA